MLQTKGYSGISVPDGTNIVSLIKLEVMIAKRLAFIEQSDNCWEQLAEEYQNFDLDSFVARARVVAPHTFYEEPYEEEIEGEIQNEDDSYILTWEDAMSECIRIYQKL